MIIKQLQAGDANDYQKLRLQGLKDHPTAFGSSYEEEKEYTVEAYQSRLQSKDVFTFGAFENEKLVGVVTLVKERKLKLRHRANIYAMYVAPDTRGKGIGKALLEEAIRKAKSLKGIEQIYLSVESTNEPAKKLYSSVGFEVFGQDKRAMKINDSYYNEDHMVLFLS